MNKKETATLAAFRQEFKDYVEYDDKWKEGADDHFKAINGKVQKHETFINRFKGAVGVISASGVLGIAITIILKVGGII